MTGHSLSQRNANHTTIISVTSKINIPLIIHMGSGFKTGVITNQKQEPRKITI